MKYRWLIAAGFLAVSISLIQGQGCQLSYGAMASLGQQLSKTSGNARVDAAFNAELANLYSTFGVHPGLFILNDYGASNAYAIPQAIQPGTDGTVAFGYFLMLTELQISRGINFSIPAIMAHEFGHIVQFEHGSALSIQQKELQADYLAGWFMGKREAGSVYTAAAIQNALYSFYSKGDYAFNSPQHHGTPEQRANILLEGLRNSELDLDAAYEASLNLVGEGRPSTGDAAALNRTTTSGGPFEETLRRVIAASSHNFRDIIGKMVDSDSDSTTYSTRVSLGQGKCEITRSRSDGPNWYTCEMYIGSDESDANGQYDGNINKVKDTVPDWISRDKDGSRTIVKRRIFDSPDDKESVEVILRSIGTKYVVSVDVNAY